MNKTLCHRTRNRTGRVRLALVALTASVAVALIASGCGADDPDPSAQPIDQTALPTPIADTSEAVEAVEVLSADSEGTTSVDDEALAAELSTLPSSAVSEADRDGLIFMREEEKLALDVYQELYGMWGLPIFDNIAGAEQTHTDSVKTLLDRFDIADPALDQPAGRFTNPELQALYNDLVERGSESITEALLVGALIEDLDIADLQARASDDPAIDLVYANLEKGSRNHLRAFIGQLDKNGASYTPSYITQAEFDEIVSSPAERGRGR